MDPSYPIARSVLIRNSRFASLGMTLEDVLEDKSLMRIDMKNSLILPGLIDSHAHLLLQGYKMSSVDLNGATSAKQVRDRIIQFLDNNPAFNASDGSWIQGMGWDQTLFQPPEFPSFEDLDVDDRLRDIPIVLYRVDAHALWTNAKGLKLSEQYWADYSSKDEILTKNGKIQGIFLDNAMDTVKAAIPEITEKEKLNALDLAIQEMLKYGVTGIHDAGVTPQDIEFFKEAIDKGKFPIRSYSMIYCPDQNFYCGNLVPRQNYKDHLFVNSVKLITDGALGSWGALMLEPYDDQPDSVGILRLTANGSIPNLVSEVISFANTSGLITVTKSMFTVSVIRLIG
jgi:predicted amidohydrolase YtcJ